MAYLAPATAVLTDAAATDEDIFNASAEFINNTTGTITLTSFDIDMDVLALGDGDVTTIDPVVIHATSDDAVARTYSSYAPIRVDAQGNSLLGVRTFRFLLATPVVLQPADAISLTLTELVSNQSTNITGVRWSSTTDSWLNTVYPIGGGEYTDAQARAAVNARISGNNLLFNDAAGTEQSFSGGGTDLGGRAWSTTDTYASGDIVSHIGRIYQAIVATPTVGTSPNTVQDPAQWKLLIDNTVIDVNVVDDITNQTTAASRRAVENVRAGLQASIDSIEVGGINQTVYSLPEVTPRTITLDPFDFIVQTEEDGTTVRTFEYTGMNTAGDTFAGPISINTGARFTETQFDSAMFIEPASIAAIEIINGVPAFHRGTNRSELQTVLGIPLTCLLYTSDAADE